MKELIKMSMIDEINEIFKERENLANIISNQIYNVLKISKSNDMQDTRIIISRIIGFIDCMNFLRIITNEEQYKIVDILLRNINILQTDNYDENK